MKIVLKVLIGVLLVIIITFGVLLFRYAYTPSYDKSTPMTKEDIQLILSKRLNVDNIYVKNVSDQKIGDVNNLISYSEFFIKDNMVKVIETTQNGKRKIYQENTDTKECIWIFETKNIIAKFQNQMSAYDLIKGSDFLDLNQDVFSSSTYTNLIYLGKTKISNRNVIAVLLERDDKVKEIIYIDEETGFILKHITKNIFTHYTANTEIAQNIVSDDDVKFINYEINYPNFRVIDFTKFN